MTLTTCEVAIEVLSERTRRVSVIGDDTRLSFREVFAEWSADRAMTDVFTRLIAASQCTALFWEMPPLTRDRLDDIYECVLIDSPELAFLAPDPAPFRQYFGGSEKIVVFSNLGADALLIAPAPEPKDAQYTHLAVFCRTAPTALSRQFWRRVGEVCLGQIGDEPIWISTAGSGVGWLHARLDSRPKYYSHAPYRRWPRD